MRASSVLFSAALAVASPVARETANEGRSPVLFHWHHEPKTNTTETTLSSADKRTVYAVSCDSELVVAGRSVKADIDNEAFGRVIVDDEKVYKVLSSREKSGGASCTSMYGGGAAVVDCLVPWDEDIESLSALSASDAPECFSKHSLASHRGLPSEFRSPLSFLSESSEIEAHDLEKRQCGGNIRTEYALEGDGSPFIQQKHIQLSNTLNCGDGSCSSGVSDGESRTIGVDAGGSWFASLGFSVSWTKSIGTSMTCNANEDDGNVCVWSQHWYQGYTAVRTTYTTLATCGVKTDTYPPYEILAPKDEATEYYCVRGTCRSKGEEYWGQSYAGT